LNVPDDSLKDANSKSAVLQNEEGLFFLPPLEEDGLLRPPRKELNGLLDAIVTFVLIDEGL
jgi:hypothetical protein